MQKFGSAENSPGEKKKKKGEKRLSLISFMTKYIHIKGDKVIPFQMSVSKKVLKAPPPIKPTPNYSLVEYCSFSVTPDVNMATLSAR